MDSIGLLGCARCSPPDARTVVPAKTFQSVCVAESSMESRRREGEDVGGRDRLIGVWDRRKRIGMVTSRFVRWTQREKMG